jgi:hypothetical protein
VRTRLGQRAAVSSLAFASHGRIIGAGWAGDDFGVAEYRGDGSLYRGFSRDGRRTISFGRHYESAWGVIQGSNRILVAGSSEFDGDGGSAFALARLKSNGTLDSEFGRHGKVLTDFSGGCARENGLAKAPDQRVEAAGFAHACDNSGNYPVPVSGVFARYDNG